MFNADDWNRLKEIAEDVALEIADHYGVLPFPIEEYYHVAIISYYENGKIYDSNHDHIHVKKLYEHYMQAKDHNWDISYNDETCEIKFEKHFPSGMYRIGTYTPYKKGA